MTVNLQSVEISTASGTVGRLVPGRWGLIGPDGCRIAVAQVRRLGGPQGDGWIEAWSVMDRESLRAMRGPRVLRYEGARHIPVPRAEATVWSAVSIARPPALAEVTARRVAGGSEEDLAEEGEGQLWQVRMVRRDAPTEGILGGWLLREILRRPDGSEVWHDHWHLLAHHRHPAPDLDWRLLPMGRSDLPTFLRQVRPTASGDLRRAYLKSSYTLPPARLRLSAFS